MEAVYGAAEIGPGRVEVLVPDPHGDVQVGQVVSRAAGQRAADHQPADPVVGIAQRQQPAEQGPLRGEFRRKVVDPVKTPGLHVVTAPSLAHRRSPG